MRCWIRKFPSIRYGYAFVLLPVCASVGFGVSTQNQTPPPKALSAQDAPEGILTACASYAQGLVPEERALLMTRIATVASVNHFPESTKWARQAFVTSSDLPASWNKVALQKNALIALASTEPADALRLLGTLPVPPHPASNQGARLDEDTRADAAHVIFPSAYRHDSQKSIPAMLEVSSYLGRTGEYPYEAWGILLPKIAKEHPGTFDEVVSTAVHFYRSGEDRTISQDQDYFDMVNALRGIANSIQMKVAVTAGIDRLQAEKPHKNETYVDVAQKGPLKTTFDSQAKALLFQWLPLVKEFDSAEYEELAKKLNVSAPPTKNTQHAAFEIEGDPKNISPDVQQDVHDHLQAQVVENDAATDPEAAIQESIVIRSMALRSDALAKGAMNVSAKAMPQRAKLLAESRRDLGQVRTKDADYLLASADLAYAYNQSKMRQSALSLVHDGLDQGAEILDESADAQPNTPTMLLDGYDSLAKLTAIGMQIDSHFTLAKVQELRNLPLKVNLLVDIAGALAAKTT